MTCPDISLCPQYQAARAAERANGTGITEIDEHLPGIPCAQWRSWTAMSVAADAELRAPDDPQPEPRLYPFLLYGKDGATRAAADEQERKKLTAEGWSENPPAAKPAVEPAEKKRS